MDVEAVAPEYTETIQGLRQRLAELEAANAALRGRLARGASPGRADWAVARARPSWWQRERQE